MLEKLQFTSKAPVRGGAASLQLMAPALLGPWLARCALRRQPGRRNQRASISSVAYHAFKVPWYDALPSRPACLVLMIWAQYQSGLTRLQWLGCEASSLWVCLVAMLHGVRALAPAPHPEADYILPLRAQLARPTTSSEVLACPPPPSPTRTRQHDAPVR